MSETKHTPGSWERSHQSREIFGGSRHIASVHTAFGVWEANEANANLIAASPDLLAACEGLVDWVDPNEAMDGLHRQIDDARAAIAKAKGKTP